MLTPLIALSVSLSQGSALQAEPLTMLSPALPCLRQFRRWGVTHGLEELGLCGGVREEFPRALALQRALREALLTRGPQEAATGITEVTCECVVGPRQARHVIAVKETRPIALAHLGEVTAKLLDGWSDIGPLPHRVERAAQLSRDLGSAHGLRGTGFSDVRDVAEPRRALVQGVGGLSQGS